MTRVPTSESRRTDPVPLRSALDVIEVFASAARVTYDRIQAGRVLGAAERAMPGEGPQVWSQRLVEAGESLNLRVRSLDCTLMEALSIVRQGIPVAFCGIGLQGEVRWTVLTDVKGRKIRLKTLDAEMTEVWVSRRSLQRSLHLESRNTVARWVIGQAALACQPPLPPLGSEHVPLTPFARLLALLRPEKHDIWVVVVFSLGVGVLALATPVAVEALVNTVAFGRYLQPVVILALLLFTFLAFAAAMRGLMTYVVEILQRRLFIRIVEDLAYRLPRTQQHELDEVHGPELVNRFFDVVTVQKAAASLLLDGVSIVLQTLIGMAVLAFYHPFLLGFDVVLLALILLIIFGLGRGALTSSIKESKIKYKVAAWLQEIVRHPTAFKLHAGPQFALERADQLAVDWLDARRHHFRIVIRQILFAFGLQAVAATALLGLGGWLVIKGELTLGQLVAAELIVTIIVGSFAKLGKHMESVYDLLASVDKLGSLFDLSIEPHDKLFHLRHDIPAAIDIREVSFWFGKRPVLQDVSLALAPGEAVALVGGPGSGKSTLVDLLCGLRAATSGHLELDGIDYRELRPDSLREHISVARSFDVFHGTIDENVHLNRTHISALDVRDALETMGLLDELLKLPDGLNTYLQTHGSPLSASQVARLMVARAIVGRPRLLIIDGLLDGLSDELLGGVLARLQAAGRPWTLLIVTGRRVVVESCDRSISIGPNSAVEQEVGNLKRF